MASRREGAETWLSVYPVEEETKAWNPEAPVFVNIGGGIGHQCAEFKAQYPQVAGRVILQDLPHTIDRALQILGVENMVHNFFEPQPVKGMPVLENRMSVILNKRHRSKILLSTRRTTQSFRREGPPHSPKRHDCDGQGFSASD